MKDELDAMTVVGAWRGAQRDCVAQRFRAGQRTAMLAQRQGNVLLLPARLLCAPTRRNWISCDLESYYSTVQVGARVVDLVSGQDC